MNRKEILDSYCHKMVGPFIERYGCWFKPRPLPSTYRTGQMGLCFANAYRMAMCHGVTYVEGLAVSRLASTAAQLHAWCVDSAGNVLDRTWGDGVAYFGVPFKTEFLKGVIADRRCELGEQVYFGLLDDWRNKWPLQTLLSDKAHEWLVESQATWQAEFEAPTSAVSQA